ncbi:hypothetical protein Pla123a_45350 [Posidoniimonas polymericola]|uniref:Uncharacterized protein n=1 Tax=Posidoniimonas polymericola TaxID=2528002 RepID=A0A5C5XUC6_9BACT|nr:archaellin/type IV pilin N-terminal domain-containing protein [Posidoniimonas polymericola]TWT66837.1 hypothetical protein Pla123a_45350 [Posidoniimonas polymericola]
MNDTPNEPTFWQQICWPVIICALLGGHMTIMLIAMTFALAVPPEAPPASYTDATLGRPATVTLPSSQPAAAPQR